MKRVLALIFLAVACRVGTGSTGPPEIHYGLEECAYCRMIVSDERFAAAEVTAEGRVATYDDLGCLMEAQVARSATASPPATVWAHDSGSGEWFRADRGWFVRLSGEATPMGSGLRGYVDRAAAERAAAERAAAAGGVVDGVLDWEAVRLSYGVTESERRNES